MLLIEQIKLIKWSNVIQKKSINLLGVLLFECQRSLILFIFRRESVLSFNIALVLILFELISREVVLEIG